jgi:hypothetical protein
LVLVTALQMVENLTIGRLPRRSGTRSRGNTRWVWGWPTPASISRCVPVPLAILTGGGAASGTTTLVVTLVRYRTGDWS